MASKGITRKTTTVEHLSARDGDPIAGRLREGMAGFAKLTIGGYAERFWACVDEPEARLDVFKRMGGQFMRVGSLTVSEVDPEDMESHIISMWRVGEYQLRPMIAKSYYAPSSISYRIGEPEETPRPQGSDLAAAVQSITELGVVRQVMEIKQALLADMAKKPGEDEGMKASDVSGIVENSMRPVMAMLESANRRAEAMEQRNHELQMKLMDMAQAKTVTTQGSVGELLKLLPKEAISALLAPADAPGWAEKAVDALREFGPALAQMLLEYFKPGAAAAVAAAGSAALPAHEPQPTGTAPGNGAGEGGGRMPLQLSPEQVEAKNMLLDCIRTKDHANGYAMLENFPGFMPTVNGPLPIGTAFLGMVDPKVTKPRIYVIQMMQLVPELASCLAEADAFVAYIQQRLMADQEAYLKEQGNKRTGDPGPRPTTQGEDDRA
jgi:hypothetical protein